MLSSSSIVDSYNRAGAIRNTESLDSASEAPVLDESSSIKKALDTMKNLDWKVNVPQVINVLSSTTAGFMASAAFFGLVSNPIGLSVVAGCLLITVGALIVVGCNGSREKFYQTLMQSGLGFIMGLLMSCTYIPVFTNLSLVRLDLFIGSTLTALATTCIGVVGQAYGRNN